MNKHVALQIVLKGLFNTPDTMPEQFPAEYLNAQKIGPTGHLKTISKLLAPVLVEAGVGPGSKFIGKTTLVKEPEEKEIIPEPEKMEEEAPAVEKPKIKEKPKAPKIKTLKLNEITHPLDKGTKQNLMIGAVNRLLAADKRGAVPLRQKILTTVAASFSDSVRESVLQFLLFDLKSNLDLALSW